MSPRTTRARTGRRTNAGTQTRSRRGGNTRAVQALELVREGRISPFPNPTAMRIQPNYLYRVLPRLASEGSIKRDGQGWHPARSSTSKPANATGNVTGRRQARAARPKSRPRHPVARGPVSARRRATTNGAHRSTGATKASVLAALADGGSMTAGQVAAKAGLARPTVSTTLSKLARPATSRRPSAATGSPPRLGAIGSRHPGAEIPRSVVAHRPGPHRRWCRSRTAAARGGMLLFGLRGDVQW